jgi:hypothetical protein
MNYFNYGLSEAQLMNTSLSKMINYAYNSRRSQFSQ